MQTDHAPRSGNQASPSRLWPAAAVSLGLLAVSVGCKALPEGSLGHEPLGRQLGLLKDDGATTASGRSSDVSAHAAGSAEPGIHVVVSGDTLWAIARAQGRTVDALARANGLSPEAPLPVGKRLRIPDPAEPPATHRRPARSHGVAPAPQEPLPRAEGRFVWPLRGKLTVTYGQIVDGFAYTGIAIASSAGRPVAAAKSGVVTFVSDGFEGWGKVVLIRHADGFHTWYGHLGSYNVRAGQAVRQGQTIAAVGSTGRADRPQLAFRVLRRGTPVSPCSYLP